MEPLKNNFEVIEINCCLFTVEGISNIQNIFITYKYRKLLTINPF